MKYYSDSLGLKSRLKHTNIYLKWIKQYSIISIDVIFHIETDDVGDGKNASHKNLSHRYTQKLLFINNNKYAPKMSFYLFTNTAVFLSWYLLWFDISWNLTCAETTDTFKLDRKPVAFNVYNRYHGLISFLTQTLTLDTAATMPTALMYSLVRIVRLLHCSSTPPCFFPVSV